MGYFCDFCGEQRSMVYCRSDAACLCLSCDRNVHSANALSRRHSRTLVCERCNSQPAFVRCVEEKISLCQNCDWLGHPGSTSGSNHKRKTVNCYSGCPSSAELSTILSFVLDIPSVSDSSEKGLSSMIITDSSPTKCGDPLQRNNGQGVFVPIEENNVNIFDTSSAWTGSSFVPQWNRLELLTDSTSPKMCCPGTKAPDLCKDVGFYEEFNMDEVGLVDIENYEELFGVAFNDPQHLFGSDGIGSLFGVKGMSAAEDSSMGKVNAMQTACSNVESADSLMSSKTEPNCFARQAHSTLSFSGRTGESNGGDYQEIQDCGASSMLLMGEPPWCPPFPENSLPSTSRSSAVLRYKEKKKTRQFDKKVRYASRKARADVRKRVKGRFVKAGEAYDYDPLSKTASF